jgi:phosphonopyruvate decarboxylase
LTKNGIDFFAGVPDSLLKNFLAVLSFENQSIKHHICANEGAAIALATGYHLATGKTPLVYMQNSGLGNAVNPLFSLSHQAVYGIPLILLIGWRGAPGTQDEPQHMAMGAKTLDILAALAIPATVFDGTCQDSDLLVSRAIASMRSSSSAVALLCREGTFAQPQNKKLPGNSTQLSYNLSREEAIEAILAQLSGEEAVICTTGYTAREIYGQRENRKATHARDFLNAGAMGHVSQIALGIALAQPDREVICLDGDGSVIMHMGTLATIGQAHPDNLKHIVLNNGVHDSVGGQLTAGFSIDMQQIALASGYRLSLKCERKEELSEAIQLLLQSKQLSFLEIRTHAGARENLPRPPKDFSTSKGQFMEFLKTSPLR